MKGTLEGGVDLFCGCVGQFDSTPSIVCWLVALLSRDLRQESPLLLPGEISVLQRSKSYIWSSSSVFDFRFFRRTSYYLLADPLHMLCRTLRVPSEQVIRTKKTCCSRKRHRESLSLIRQTNQASESLGRRSKQCKQREKLGSCVKKAQYRVAEIPG